MRILDNIKGEEYPENIYVSRTVMDRFETGTPLSNLHFRPITSIPVIYSSFLTEGDYIVEYQTYGILYKKDGTQLKILKVTIPTVLEPIRIKPL